MTLTLTDDFGFVKIGAVKPPSKVSTPCARSPPTNASHVSPSRRRRTLRRAEARTLFAEEAKLDLSVEELSVLNAAEKAVDDSVQNMESDEHDSLEVKDDSNDTQNERATCLRRPVEPTPKI